MHRQLTKITAASALVLALMAGCGGGGGGDNHSGNPPAVPSDIAQNVDSVYAYVLALIGRGENTDPVDINGITLANDEMMEPRPVN